MLHGVFKQHQIHDGVDLIVAIQRLREQLVKLCPPANTRHVLGLSDTGGEVTEDVGFLAHRRFVDVLEVLLGKVEDHLLEGLDVFLVDELVAVHALRLVHPDARHVYWRLDALRG